jgi:hypothetical protein
MPSACALCRENHKLLSALESFRSSFFLPLLLFFYHSP